MQDVEGFKGDDMPQCNKQADKNFSNLKLYCRKHAFHKDTELSARLCRSVTSNASSLKSDIIPSVLCPLSAYFSLNVPLYPIPSSIYLPPRHPLLYVSPGSFNTVTHSQSLNC